MNKFYTCYFESFKIGKNILKDLFFVSLDKESWHEIKFSDVSIDNYQQIKKLFTPKKNKNGGFTYKMSTNIMAIKLEASCQNIPVVIKEITKMKVINNEKNIN